MVVHGRHCCTTVETLCCTACGDLAFVNVLTPCACRTKRFRKSGDVDFAQILGRGVRALDLEMSCDTHGSMGAHAQASCLDFDSLLAAHASCLYWLDVMIRAWPCSMVRWEGANCPS